MVVHAALAVLLARLSGTGDIAIGTPVAGRGDAALDDLVGMFVNTLVLRTEVDRQRSISRRCSITVPRHRHRRVRQRRRARSSASSRCSTRSARRRTHPLFQVMLTFNNLATTTFDLAGLHVEPISKSCRSPSSISSSRFSSSAAVSCAQRSTYATDIFSESTAAAYADRFVRMLEAVVADPAAVIGDIDLLTETERASVTGEWTSLGEGAAVEATLAELFGQAAAQNPERVAVRFGEASLTYRELDQRTNALARILIDAGVGPEDLVAVALPRSLDLVVALVATIKAGGGYLPIDPDYPFERLEFMLTDAKPACLVTSSLVEGLPATGVQRVLIDSVDLSSAGSDAIADADRVRPLRSTNVAYVIYTSGSTGRPKGVAGPAPQRCAVV